MTTMTDLNSQETQRPSLRGLAPEDAFKLAYERSKKELREIAKEMGWSESHTKRIFSTERYFPTFEDIPKFCSVVGNMQVINWLQVQAMQYGVEEEHQSIDCQALVFRISQLFSETSDVGQQAHEAVADGILEPVELRRLIRELNDVVDVGIDMIGDLRALERELKEQE